MDLLSRINQAYSSDEDSDENPQPTLIPPVKLAPLVDVTELEEAQKHKELTKFETTNQLITKPNHLTGVVEQISVNPAKFYE